ncbi:hypothetical protein [Azospirillum sp. Marseille-Q6669]
MQNLQNILMSSSNPIDLLNRVGLDKGGQFDCSVIDFCDKRDPDESSANAGKADIGFNGLEGYRHPKRSMGCVVTPMVRAARVAVTAARANPCSTNLR